MVSTTKLSYQTSYDYNINYKKYFYIKDPGSAITHFIGMIAAFIGAFPLLYKAARTGSLLACIAMAVYSLSMIALYGASTTYHTFDKTEQINTILKKIDHMMIFVLIAGSYTPVCLLVLRRGNRSCHADHRLVHRNPGNGSEILLGLLSQVGFFYPVYRNGLGLHLCNRQAAPHSDPCRIRMAPGRWYYLHGRRRHLRTETSDLQRKAPELRKPRDLPSFRHGWKPLPLHFYVCIRPVTNLFAVRPAIQPRIIVRGFFFA